MFAAVGDDVSGDGVLIVCCSKKNDQLIEVDLLNVADLKLAGCGLMKVTVLHVQDFRLHLRTSEEKGRTVRIYLNTLSP